MADEHEDDGGEHQGEPPTPPTPPKKGETPPKKAEGLSAEEATELRAENARIKDALKKANSEAADRRVRLQEIERKEQEARDKELPEMERLKKERDDYRRERDEAKEETTAARRQVVENRIQNAVERQAGIMNFTYPDIAYSLINRRDVRINEDTDRVEGVKEALERLLKEKPELAKAPVRGAPPTRGGSRCPGQASGNGRQREEPPMSPEEELRALGGYD